MPDLFHGDPTPLDKPPGFDFMKWLSKHGIMKVDPIITSAIKMMREELHCERIGGVGYCFGAKYVARFLKPGKLDAGFFAHPSFVSAEELKGIQGPLSIAASGKPKNRRVNHST